MKILKKPLIGLKIEIIKSKNSSLIGAAGKVIDETKNTICGRNPIKILLSIIGESKNSEGLKSKLVHYAQSSQVRSLSESSVSYASIITYLST